MLIKLKVENYIKDSLDKFCHNESFLMPFLRGV